MRPSGPETASNPQDAETGGPIVESPCENERLVEMREVYHRPPTPGDLGGNKEAAVEAGRKRSRFNCSLRAKICHLSAQSQSPDGRWGVAGKGNGHTGKGGSHQEGNPVTEQQDLHNPAVGTPRLPHPPMLKQTTPITGEGHDPYLRKPRSEDFKAELGAGELK